MPILFTARDRAVYSQRARLTGQSVKPDGQAARERAIRSMQLVSEQFEVESRFLTELSQAEWAEHAGVATSSSLGTRPVLAAAAPRALLAALRSQRDLLVKERAALAWVLQAQQRMDRDMRDSLTTILRTVEGLRDGPVASPERPSKGLEAELRSSQARLLAAQRDRRQAVSRSEALEAEVTQLKSAQHQKVQRELASSRTAFAQAQRRAQAAEASASAARAGAEDDRRRCIAAEAAVAAAEQRRCVRWCRHTRCLISS